MESGRSESLKTDQICSRATLVDCTDAAWYTREILFAMCMMLPHTSTRCLRKQRISPTTLATLTQFHLFMHPTIFAILYIDSKTPPLPHFQEHICLSNQKCWVLLFALYTEIRWGCKLSQNICSLEGSMRGEARTGLVRAVHCCSVRMCYVYVWVHAQLFKQVLCILLSALLVAPRKRKTKYPNRHTHSHKTGALHFNFLDVQIVW